MKGREYRYIYGPVPSWRLGASLGVDPVYTGKGKVCSFDCVYCQVGKTRDLTRKRKIFVSTEKILEELKSLPAVRIDYVTLSGAGEPTLASNIGAIIKGAREITKNKIAVITNSSLFGKKKLREELLSADYVTAKLDAHSQELFEKINRPARGVRLSEIIKGMKLFRKKFKGKFALQIMFIPENKKYAREIARLSREIKPDEVQLNTPLRPSGAKPLSRKEMRQIKSFFKGVNVVSVYEARKKKKIKPLTKKGTFKRRGKT